MRGFRAMAEMAWHPPKPYLEQSEDVKRKWRAAAKAAITSFVGCSG